MGDSKESRANLSMENQRILPFLLSAGRRQSVRSPFPRTEQIGQSSGGSGTLLLQLARRKRSLNPRLNSMKRAGRHGDLNPAPSGLLKSWRG